MLIKVCGMTDEENLLQVIALQPDMLGFIFYPTSKRYVDASKAKSLCDLVPPSIKKVGVFVNEQLSKIQQLANECNLDVVQLHGNESPEVCASLKNDGLLVLKAFGIGDTFSITSFDAFNGSVDFFLLDTKAEDYGGSGKKFNWDLLKGFEPEHPFLLSGGISIDDTRNLLPLLKNKMLVGFDLNSQFEISPGYKDAILLRQFFESMRKQI